jgi:hypothetical protein
MRLSILEEKGLSDAHFPLVLGLVRVTSGKISIDSSSRRARPLLPERQRQLPTTTPIADVSVRTE